MSFATGVIGGSGTNVWKPDPTLTPGVDGDPFAPFELGLTVTLDDRSFQVAQFCRIGAAGLLIDDTAAIVDGVTTTATEENFWTNKTGVDLVEGDYAFLFSTIINGAASGGGVTGATGATGMTGATGAGHTGATGTTGATGGGGSGTVAGATGQVGYFTASTVVGGDAGFTYDAATDTATLVTALDVPLVTHTVTGGNADCKTTATSVTTGDSDATVRATADTGNATAALNATTDAGYSDVTTVATSTTSGNSNSGALSQSTTGNAYANNGAVTFTGDATAGLQATVQMTGAAQTYISSSSGEDTHHVGVEATATDSGTMTLRFDTGDNWGSAGDFMVADGTSGKWLAPTVRHAAGVPTGAPGYGELPIAFDGTAVTGGLYFWDGAAWVKGSTIP